MPELRFTVLGRPQPQGSIKAFMVAGKPHLTSDNPKMKPWRQDVGWQALEAARNADWPVGGIKGAGIFLAVDFYFARPKSAKKRVSPTVKPDADKLLRALGDALTGIAYADDAQVVRVTLAKHYGQPERAEVVVRTEQDGHETHRAAT